ncbi:MAG: nucleoside monophosphate kinase [Candidatus Dojkabacteria bacterium]|nr:nucleoside monophosphate kinase [Candidatus Dojkabacteria bacterium]
MIPLSLLHSDRYNRPDNFRPSGMKGVDFPAIPIRTSSKKSHDITSPSGRSAYFNEKVGPEIRHLKKFFQKNTFIAYMLGKKMAGKGTYTKILQEIFGEDKIRHVSFGDIARANDSVTESPDEKQALCAYLEKRYRGFMPLTDALDAFCNRSTKTLLPTEFMLELVKREIDTYGKTTLFIDGFPRNLDQITHSLYFRNLINYRDDQDLFVLLDVPEQIIDERIKYRRICPKCQTSRNLRLNTTSDVRYDKKTDEFYLMCDNPECEPTRMVQKEGDHLGVESIRSRLDEEDALMRKAMELHGIPRILVRNSIPVEDAPELVNEYEITQMKTFSTDVPGTVHVQESNWEITDENGVRSYCLYPAPVVVTIIKQLAEVLS